MKEIIKAVLYSLLGIIIGLAVGSDIELIFKVIIACGIIIIIVLSCIFFCNTNSTKNRTVVSSGQTYQSARISRDTNQVRKLYEEPKESKVPESASAPAKIENNKNSDRDSNATKIVLINEEGQNLLEWTLNNKTSLIIGKSTDKEPVDIDLSGSAVAQMISKQHAVLNYTDNGWYIDDIDSKNGTKVRKISANSILDIKLVGAVEVTKGDIIYIANTMLQLQ